MFENEPFDDGAPCSAENTVHIFCKNVPIFPLLSAFSPRCPAAKDYFKDLSGHWSWAVQWLQKKVSPKHNSAFGKVPAVVSENHFADIDGG